MRKMKHIKTHKEITIKEINELIDKAEASYALGASYCRQFKISEHWYYVLKTTLEEGNVEKALKQLESFRRDHREGKSDY